MRARVQFRAIPALAETERTAQLNASCLVRGGALGGTRTPNLLIRSQMLYPLSYERRNQKYTAVRALAVCAGGASTEAHR